MSSMRIEVVYATASRQELVALELEQGTTVAEAIERSGLAEKFAEFEVDPARVGIFSRKVRLDHVLRDGDRVEIYRRLRVDPKEARRQRERVQSKT